MKKFIIYPKNKVNSSQNITSSRKHQYSDKINQQLKIIEDALHDLDGLTPVPSTFSVRRFADRVEFRCSYPFIKDNGQDIEQDYNFTEYEKIRDNIGSNNFQVAESFGINISHDIDKGITTGVNSFIQNFFENEFELPVEVSLKFDGMYYSEICADVKLIYFV